MTKEWANGNAIAAADAQRWEDVASNAVRRGDLNVDVKTDYAAVGDATGNGGGTDDAPAIQAAIDATPFGGTCFVPPARYRCSSPLTIDKPMRLDCGVGDLGGGAPGGTALIFDAGIDGIVVDSQYGGGIEIGPFRLQGQALTDPTATGVGLHVTDGRVKIPRGLFVQYFGSHGILLDSGAAGEGRNTDLSYMASVRVQGCLGDGIKLTGVDSNGITIVSPNVVTCGGWGINNEGVRNNIYGPVVVQTNAGALGAYRDNGSSNSWHDVYSEQGKTFLLDTLCKFEWITFGQFAAPTISDTRAASGSVGFHYDGQNGMSFRGVQYLSGTAVPEGSVTASPGSIYHRISGTGGVASSRIYVKESGVGNTGWRSVNLPATRTSAQLGSVADSINTTGKSAGAPVWCSDLGIPMWAAGSATTDKWVDATGAAGPNTITPS